MSIVHGFPEMCGSPQAVNGFTPCSPKDFALCKYAESQVTPISVELSLEKGRIASMKQRIYTNIDSEAKVGLDPCPGQLNMKLLVGDIHFDVRFPFPVFDSGCKLRVSRKSGFVDVIAQPLRTSIQRDLVNCSMTIDQTKKLKTFQPGLMPRIPLDVLSRIEGSNINCLPMLGSVQFSTSELAQIKASPAIPFEAALPQLRQSISEMFLQMQKGHRIFGIHVASCGGVNAVVCVDSFRADSTHDSIVLDAAICFLEHKTVGKIAPFFMQCPKGMVAMSVSEKELELWRSMARLFVESARAKYCHDPTKCMYFGAKGPNVKTGYGERCFCQCGDGVLPETIRTVLGPTAKYFSRIAIPYLFPSIFTQSRDHTSTLGLNDKMANMATNPNQSITVTAVPEMCACCGKSPGKLRCSRCKSAHYRVRDCQKKDWPNHKLSCK